MAQDLRRGFGIHVNDLYLGSVFRFAPQQYIHKRAVTYEVPTTQAWLIIRHLQQPPPKLDIRGRRFRLKKTNTTSALYPYLTNEEIVSTQCRR